MLQINVGSGIAGPVNQPGTKTYVRVTFGEPDNSLARTGSMVLNLTFEEARRIGRELLETANEADRLSQG